MGDTDATLVRTRAADDTKVPWWVAVGFRAIKEIGFPIVVCAFLLWNQFVTIDGLKTLMARAVAILEKMEKKLPTD